MQDGSTCEDLEEEEPYIGPLELGRPHEYTMWPPMFVKVSTYLSDQAWIVRNLCGLARQWRVHNFIHKLTTIVKFKYVGTHYVEGPRACNNCTQGGTQSQVSNGSLIESAV